MMDALAAADKAFVSWAARPIEERAKIISRAAQLLLERKSELAKLATLEMGKRIAESRGEVDLSAAILQFSQTTPRSSLHRSPSSRRWETLILSFLPWAFC
jgi:acyl-CoA reductase-like NAD-dependent aldehyde dehydrogenase